MEKISFAKIFLRTFTCMCGIFILSFIIPETSAWHIIAVIVNTPLFAGILLQRLILEEPQSLLIVGLAVILTSTLFWSLLVSGFSRLKMPADKKE